MSDKENKKTGQELTDEALDAVSGGLYGNDEEVICAKCYKPIKKLQATVIDSLYYCSTCANDPTGAKSAAIEY